MIIRNKIDLFMEEKALNDEQLAFMTSLTKMTIYNARMGKNITLSTAIKITEALGETLDSVFTNGLNIEEIEEEEVAA